MSIHHCAWAWEQGRLSPPEKLVLLVLANFALPDGTSWPSCEVIADQSGCTVTEVVSALKALRSAGLIAILGTDGQQVKYRVGPEGGAS